MIFKKSKIRKSLNEHFCYAIDLTRLVDSSGWLWPAIVVGQKRYLLTLFIISHDLDFCIDKFIYFVHA